MIKEIAIDIDIAMEIENAHARETLGVLHYAWKEIIIKGHYQEKG